VGRRTLATFTAYSYGRIIIKKKAMRVKIMKPSKYNRFILLENGDYIIFNAISCAFTKVNKETFDQIEGILQQHEMDNISSATSDSIEEKLKEGSFLVPEDLDELDLLKIHYKKSCFKSHILEIIILPTLACNFNCEYCFVDRHQNSMGEEIENQVGQFVEDLIDRERGAISSLHVQWFGGEPMLAFNNIKYLTRIFTEICKSRGIEYSAFMFTNGSLLKKRLIPEIKKQKITEIMVTIDGPREIHNQRRPFKEGKGSSYDIIISNLKSVISQIRTIINITVDKRNYQTIPTLIEDIRAQGLLNEGSMAKVQFSFVNDSPFCRPDQLFRYDNPDDLKVLISFIDKVGEYGLQHIKLPRLAGSHCIANAMNSYIIDPFGYIFKCYINPKKEHSIGHVSKPLNFFNANNVKIMSFDPFSIEYCRQCEILPLCLGGCVATRLEQGDKTRPICSFWKYGLDSSLKIFVKHFSQKNIHNTK
jgi:uncharacterized protein